MITRKIKFYEQQRVHIDVDDKQWGRVASDATIIAIGPRGLLVSADSIRANIWVRRREARP